MKICQSKLRTFQTSNPDEVAEWLEVKGFSGTAQRQLRVPGHQLFALSRAQLERVLGADEGKRLYSHVLVQRNVSGVSAPVAGIPTYFTALSFDKSPKSYIIIMFHDLRASISSPSSTRRRQRRSCRAFCGRSGRRWRSRDAAALAMRRQLFMLLTRRHSSVGRSHLTPTPTAAPH